MRYFRRVKVIKPLDWMPYIKSEAMDFLQSEYGWRPYPQKHFESRFTRFYEGYWLPKRFGFDTRKVQYSSLILTGQMTRDGALEALKTPALDEAQGDQEFKYVAKKLGLENDELLELFNMPLKNYKDYPNQMWLFNVGARILKTLGVERSIKR